MDTLYTKAVLHAAKANDDGQKVYTFRATTAAVDRTGEVVTLDGWQFANWEQNPVILDAHNYYGIESIVGRGVPPLRLVDGAWEVDVAFSDTPKGQIAQQLVDEGSLRAVSVGFRSIERVSGKADEPMKHTVKELLEISVVPVPANQEAVRVRQLVAGAEDLALEVKAGRTLSAKNESLIRTAAEALQSVLSSLGSAEPEDESASGKSAADAAEPVLAVDLAPMRAFIGQQ